MPEPNPTVDTPSRTWLIITVALLTMIAPFSIDTYLPSFTAIEATFHINRAQMSHSLGVYLVAFGVSTLFWGPMSDRLGRRGIILGTLVLYGLAATGCALAGDYQQLLWFRMVQGFAASGCLTASRAMIRDAYGDDNLGAHKAMSMVMTLFAVAPAVAPIIGGLLQDSLGWRSVFGFLAVFAGTLLVLAGWVAHETLPPDRRQSIHPRYVLRQYWRSFTHGRFLSLVLLLGSFFSGLFLYISGAPTVIFDFLGLDSTHFGLLFVPMTAGLMSGAFLSGRLTHRMKTDTIVNLSFAGMVLANLLNLAQASWLPPTPVSVISTLVLYAFAMALAMPAVTVLALDCFPNNRGMASAMQGFFHLLSTAIATSVVAPLLAGSPLEFALGQSGYLLLAIGLWLWVRNRL